MDEEIFYDSLEEDDQLNRSSSGSSPRKTPSESPRNLEDVVPLYTGEIKKSDIPPGQVKKKKSERSLKKIDSDKKKKSYLTMYYEKMNRNKQQMMSNTGSGCITCRAVCEDASPRNISDVEQSSEKNETDSENEEFYKKVLALELNRQIVSEPAFSPKISSDRNNKTAKTNAERPFLLKTCEGDSEKKLESLKKRLSYGTKMSKKNMIEIGEMKELRKIKHCSSMKK